VNESRLARLLAVAVVAHVLIAPPGASWPNAFVAVCGLLALVVVVREQPEPEWSPHARALEELRR
jgi:hypothetical protein